MTDPSLNSGSTAVVSNQEAARGELAAWLRHARERSGLSIDAVSQETRISKTYILSLESGNLEGLPGKVFGRGFVKNITRLLRSDTSEGLRLYDACWNSAVITPAAETSADQSGQVSNESHKTKTVQARIAEPVNISSAVTQRLMTKDFPLAGEKPRLPSNQKSIHTRGSIKLPAWLVHSFVSPQIRLWVLAGLATVFVGLVFGRWAAGTLHKGRLTASQVATSTMQSGLEKSSLPSVDRTMVDQEMAMPEAEASTTTAAEADNTAPPANLSMQNPVSSSTQVTAGTTMVSGNSVAADEDNPLYMPSASAAAFEQVLEVKVTNDVDIKLTIDGKKVERTRYLPDTYRFTFNDKAEISLGDASMVDVIYNGKSLGVLGSKGRKRRIFLQAKATSEDFPQ